MTENQLARLTQSKLSFRLFVDQQNFYDNNDIVLCSSLKEMALDFMIEGEEQEAMALFKRAPPENQSNYRNQICA